jgi:hypothetical protein
MPETPDIRNATAANRMYWESDDSVADIAARFDFSRRALYHAVQPLPTGVACDLCGGELVFENRLARKGGQAMCASCGVKRDGVTAVAAESDAMPTPLDGGESQHADGRADARGGDVRQRAVLLSGAALAGIAIGGVATWLARRRD